MAEDLHGFITGQLWLKLKADVAEFRVFNLADLAHAAYFQVRRYLLIQPGWMCRADLTAPADLVLFRGERFKCLLGFECLLKPGLESYFPAEMLSERMNRMRRTLASLCHRTAHSSDSFEKGASGAGYLFGLFDTAESWFFPADPSPADSRSPGSGLGVRGSGPDSRIPIPESCHWLPMNCRDLPNHAEWRRKWEDLAAE